MAAADEATTPSACAGTACRTLPAETAHNVPSDPTCSRASDLKPEQARKIADARPIGRDVRFGVIRDRIRQIIGETGQTPPIHRECYDTSACHIRLPKKKPRLCRGAEEFICCQRGGGSSKARTLPRRQRAVCRQLLARHLAIVISPVDAELDGQQPLDLGRKHVFAMVGRPRIIPGLAVIPGFAPRLVGLVEPVNALG